MSPGCPQSHSTLFSVSFQVSFWQTWGHQHLRFYVPLSMARQWTLEQCCKLFLFSSVQFCPSSWTFPWLWANACSRSWVFSSVVVLAGPSLCGEYKLKQWTAIHWTAVGGGEREKRPARRQFDNAAPMSIGEPWARERSGTLTRTGKVKLANADGLRSVSSTFQRNLKREVCDFWDIVYNV